MHRILVEHDELVADTFVPSPAAERHLKAVRLKSGEEVELFDGQGRTKRCRWTGKSLDPVGGIVMSPKPAFKSTLLACVTKGSRWDWTIEKAVELGVSCIVPVISERCVVRLAPDEREAKAQRWRRIAADAARQSDAVWLPEVREAVDFNEALTVLMPPMTAFVGIISDPPPPPIWRAVGDAVKNVSSPDASFGVFVGPEGDFTTEEAAALAKAATPVSLGPTILRAETAAIFALSVLMAAGQST